MHTTATPCGARAATPPSHQHRDHTVQSTGCSNIRTVATPCIAQAAATSSHQQLCHTVHSTSYCNTIPSTPLPHRAENSLLQPLEATPHRAELNHHCSARSGNPRGPPGGACRCHQGAEQRVPLHCEALGRHGGQPSLWLVIRRGSLWPVATVPSPAFGRCGSV